MSLSADLISQFVKATNDTNKEKTETTVYGTIVKYADRFYVQIDSSDQLTPYETTADVAEGDRVTVRIKNHTATVNGNLKSPAARTDDLKGLAQSVVEMGTVIADKVDTKILKAEQARIDSLVSENVTINGKLTAGEAEIAKIKTDYLDAKAIEAKYATIENLTATNASIYSLTSTYGTFADLTASRLNAAEAVIDKLDVNYAKLDEFTAVKGKVDSLEAGVADIDTLIFGSATGTTIQTSFANSVIAQLGDAQIKSAMIDSLSASKITAGKISTNLVQIASDDNSMLISDGTIQISDGNYVRVQIGKDASNDYSINIWDANGKLLFSEGGITENAIKSSIIRNDMVADNANISAGKLDINSLFEEINGSDKTIKSTKVYLDEKNQTLDVSFKQMTSDVEGLVDDVSSQGTSLSIIQGQIESKVWKQDINAATGELNTQYTDLKQSLDGFKMEVGQSYATKEDLANFDLSGGNLINSSKSFGGDDLYDYNFYLTSVLPTLENGGFTVRYVDDVFAETRQFARYNNIITPKAGGKYTFSFYAKGSGAAGTNYDSIEVHLFGGKYNIVSAVSSVGNNVVMYDSYYGEAIAGAKVSFSLSNTYERYWVTFTLEDEDTTGNDINAKSIRLAVDDENCFGPLSAYVYGCMLEESDEVSDWSQSLVDSIGPVVSEKVSALEVSLENITSRVSATETGIGSLETKITQTAGNIELAVKQIAIGGTNMLKNTKSFKGDNINNGNSALVSGETYNGFSIRSFDYSSATSGYKDVVSFIDTYPIELEGEYTFSFYAKGSGENTLSTFFYGPTGYVKVAKCVQSNGVTGTSEDGNTKWTLTNQWKRYWVTWKLKNYGDISLGKWILFRLHYGGTVSICGCQLEKGNKVSDWSYHPEDTNEKFASLKVTVDGIYSEVYGADGKFSTLQQTAEDLTFRLNDLRGTNLLRNTRDPQDASRWTRGNIVKDSELNENVFYMTNSSTTETTAGTYRIPVIGGEKYTVSAYVKRTANVGSIDFFFLSRQEGETTDFTIIQHKSNMVPEANVWTKYTWTFTMDANAYEGYLRIDHNGSTDGKESKLYYTKIKMEKGDRATDWTPAPEDTNAAAKTATNYLNFSGSGLVVGNHTATSLKGNVLIDNDSVDIRNGTTVLSTFSADSVKLGLSTSKNVVLNTDGIHLYEGSTYMAYFKPTEVRLGNKTGSNTNIKIANDLITFRAGNTATATYGANEIHLGLNAQDTTIYLCDDIGKITGYEDDYGMGMSMTSSVLAFNADGRIVLDATNDASVSRRGTSVLALHPANSAGTVGPSIRLELADWNMLANTIDYSSLTIENGNMYLLVEDNDINSSGWIDITPTQVEVGPYLKTSSLSTGFAWINNVAFDGNNHVLWSGGEQMGANKQIAFSEAVSSQPNGIVLIFSRYSSSAVQNYHWQSFFVPKSQIVNHSGNGHTFMLTTDGAFGVIGAKYLYLRDTGITGNAINEAPSRSTGLTYYKYSNNSYVDSAVTFQNSGFVLRYVIGV